MDYKTRLEQLEHELNNRCSELVELREKLTRVRKEAHTYYENLLSVERKKAYTEGYEKGWQEGRIDTDWNLT